MFRQQETSESECRTDNFCSTDTHNPQLSQTSFTPTFQLCVLEHKVDESARDRVNHVHNFRMWGREILCPLSSRHTSWPGSDMRQLQYKNIQGSMWSNTCKTTPYKHTCTVWTVCLLSLSHKPPGLCRTRSISHCAKAKLMTSPCVSIRNKATSQAQNALWRKG